MHLDKSKIYFNLATIKNNKRTVIGNFIMRKTSFFIIFALFITLFLTSCSTEKLVEAKITEQVEITKEVEVTRQVEITKEVEVTRQVEITKEVEVTRQVEITKLVEKAPEELGPWTIQDTITHTGQYLVPEEMQPGQWSYIADDPDDTCWATTYSDLSGSNDSILNRFHSENKGFFVLNENVRMVELNFGPCTWTRIGDE